ncbi:hypothetical protein E4V01_07385 [Methylorubrum sp. Q1]|uniref:GSU2403 family nucleotidyltransferase fold protein n=1 Tax=Methylorubrum sp. Q1 TaxID=2562453 RepID=UPI00107693B7|nr:GSU2403 family nucleotidyltransferase fold protein [Methylorubrum sp. Q1]TFZ59765.1 hypothetical protein E4V01_07385 [Methylorubrum sp. Q1]
MAAFSDEQLRCAANLEPHYENWLDAARAKAALPYGMRWATRDGKEYLYEALDRKGNAKSLGRRDEGTEATYRSYVEAKEACEERLARSRATLAETCSMYRALRLPQVASKAAAILREADLRRLLGSHLLVVGTNAMPAYALEAGGAIDAPDQTDDFDMAWTGEATQASVIWPMLKAVDDTYTVNTEKTFQARNASAYEVEFLAAPSRTAGIHRLDQPKPVPLDEQEWLLPGTRVTRVVVGLDGSPARIVAPDPRWFALQKLWMAEQPKRNPLKRPKDAKQGTALLTAVADRMPQYPLGEEFAASLPGELEPYFEAWRATRDSSLPAEPAW